VKPARRRKLWRSIPLSEDDTKMSHKEKSCGSVNSIHVGSQGRVLCWAVVNIAVNLELLYKILGVS
jgi:hypothetical protein